MLKKIISPTILTTADCRTLFDVTAPIDEGGVRIEASQQRRDHRRSSQFTGDDQLDSQRVAQWSSHQPRPLAAVALPKEVLHPTVAPKLAQH